MDDLTLRRALVTYGARNQILLLMEEMAELQDALCKYRRGRVAVADVVTEIADVTIMCRQMALHFGADAVDAEIEFKVKRLNERMNQ